MRLDVLGLKIPQIIDDRMRVMKATVHRLAPALVDVVAPYHEINITVVTSTKSDAYDDSLDIL